MKTPKKNKTVYKRILFDEFLRQSYEKFDVKQNRRAS